MTTGQAAAHAPKRVGIVGLGLMGRGIATCLLAHGHEVIGHDHDGLKFASALAQAKRSLARLKKEQLLSKAAERTWRARFTQGRELADLRACDIVIECVREDLTLKRNLLEQLEAIVGKKDHPRIQHLQPADLPAATGPRVPATHHRHALGRTRADHALP